MNHTGVIKVYLIGTREYAYRIKFKRATVPEWLIIAMNSIGDKIIGFGDEAGAEDQTDIPATGELGNDVGLLEGIDIDKEADPDEQENYGAGEIDKAIVRIAASSEPGRFLRRHFYRATRKEPSERRPTSSSRRRLTSTLMRR